METNEKTLIAAVRRHCLECSGGERKLVEKCSVTGCALWEYRCAQAQEKAERKRRGLEGQISILDFKEAVV